MRLHRVIVIGTLLLGQLCSWAQDGRIILTLDDVPVSEALKSIRQQAEIPLAYDARGLKRIRVSGELVTDDVEVALRFVLKDTPFTFEARGGTYLIVWFWAARPNVLKINAKMPVSFTSVLVMWFTLFR